MLYSPLGISGGMGMGMQGGRGGGFNTGFNSSSGANMQGHFNPAFMQGDGGQFDSRKRYRMDGGG
jgi:hypothetical protein